MTIPDSGLMMENEASCLPHTPDEEKKIIDELTRQSEANVKEGALFFVISNRFYSLLYFDYSNRSIIGQCVCRIRNNNFDVYRSFILCFVWNSASRGLKVLYKWIRCIYYAGNLSVCTFLLDKVFCVNYQFHVR